MKNKHLPRLISISGGRTSGMMAYLELQRYNAVGKPERIPDNVHFVFCNTSAEHPSTYKFLDDMIKSWGMPLICLEWTDKKIGNSKFTKKYNVVDFSDIITDKSLFKRAIYHVGGGKSLPHANGRYCSDRMKQQPCKQFMQDKGYKDFVNVLGIRADEPRRLNFALKEWRKGCVYKNEYPLWDAGIKKSDIFKFWDNMPFNLELPIIQGKNPFGNCLGCFMKSEAEHIMILQQDINALDYLIEMENETGQAFKRVDGVDMWLSDLKQHVKTSPPQDIQLGLELDVYCPNELGACTE